MSRIENVPIYEQRKEMVPAQFYNIWRRFKLHYPLPLRMRLKGLTGLLLIVEKQRWICVNSQQGDLPVIAWLDFEDQGREAIHEPVRCKVNYYHFAAARIAHRVLELMELGLEQKLKTI